MIEGDVFETIIPLGRAVAHVPRDVTTDTTSRTGESTQRVLQILRDHGSIPARELATEIGLSDRQVKRVLTRLRELGVIKREGSTRYGHWIVVD